MRTRCLLIACQLAMAMPASARIWTDDQGRKVDADYGGRKGDDVLLVMKSGLKKSFPLAKLCAEDQAFVTEQEKMAGAAAADVDYLKLPPPAPHTPIEKRLWPVEVIVGTGSVNPSELPPKGSSHFYRLGRFQFETGPDLSVPVVKEIARTFVAVEELIERLPWDLRPTPANGEYFVAKLYQNLPEYAAVAPANSGGFYSLTEKVFHVPYAALGITHDSKKGWVKSKEFDSDTLIHELTHMMMDRIVPYVPIWVAEGSAEYVEAIPFSNTGVMRPGDLPKALPGYIAEMTKSNPRIALASQPVARAATMVKVLHMSHEAWHSFIENAPPPPEAPPGFRIIGNPEIGARQRDLYLHACLLFYYFLHLDNPRQRGEPMLSFFDAVSDNVPKWHLWRTAYDRYRSEVVDYQKAWEEFKTQPGVEDLGGGRIRYPKTLQPPASPKEPPTPFDLEKVSDEDPGLVLIDRLIQGRSDEELAAAFREGFARIGIKL